MHQGWCWGKIHTCKSYSKNEDMNEKYMFMFIEREASGKYVDGISINV